MTMQPIRPEDLEALVADFERSDFTVLHVRIGDTEVYLSKNADDGGIGVALQPTAHAAHAAHAAPRAPSAPPAAPAATPLAAAPAAAPAALVRVDIPDGMAVVTAPCPGTFYRAPKPGAAPYVEIGQTVAPTDELCLVEVMKLFTAVRAGVAGSVRQILARDGDMVEADQPLFVIEPAT